MFELIAFEGDGGEGGGGGVDGVIPVWPNALYTDLHWSMTMEWIYNTISFHYSTLLPYIPIMQTL